MSSFLSRIKVRSALQRSRNKFDLSCSHLTTQDFYSMKPVYIHECIPGEKIHINMQAFTRLSPLVQPMLGSVRMVNRAFFVPMRTVMSSWNNFITNTPCNDISFQGLVDNVYRFKLGTLYSILANANYRYSEEIESGDEADFVYYYSNAYHKYKLTQKGKLVWNILQSLGYKLNISLHGTSASDENMYVSALPLFAFTKIWIDWFKNPAYDTSDTLESLFTINPSIPLEAGDLHSIFDAIITINYESDYFTSAWDNPTTPNQTTTESVIEFDDNTTITLNASQRNKVAAGSTDVPASANGATPVIQQSNYAAGNYNAAPKAISQFMLDALHSVTDFVKRHQLVGTRALDRYMAEYGIQLSSEKLRRSVYIGKYDADIQISDVMQTTESTDNGTSLGYGVGNYTGKGIGYGNGNFDFETDEYGYIIITSYIEPKINYVDGRPRMLQHITKTDFFNGDFDAMGVQAIRQDELIANGLQTRNYSGEYRADGIFGYVPRYAEYKVALDNQTGDFCLNSKNRSLEGWSLNRTYSLDEVAQSGLPIKHNLEFTQADGTQFNDIWQYQGTDYDHFFTIFRFNVDVYAPMKTLFDMYDYSNEDGKEMNLSLNGTHITE